MAEEKQAAQQSAAKAAETAAQAEEATTEAQAASAEEQQTDLAKQVADLQAQIAEKDDQYLRAQAEIQNMTKRFAKEREGLLKYDGQDLAKGILPVLDNLKRALEIEVVHDHLEKALQDHGVTEIDALNKPFDPQTSQAVQTVPVADGQTPDTVVQVLQAGYVLKDRVLRPAMVIVAQ